MLTRSPVCGDSGMLDLGGSSRLPLSSSPRPANGIPTARAIPTATGASHQRLTSGVPPNRPVSRPVRGNTIAASGNTKPKKWSSWVSPTNPKTAEREKASPHNKANVTGRFELFARSRQRAPAATPVIRAPTATVALLKRMSSGEWSGRETRTATIAEIEPAQMPAIICPYATDQSTRSNPRPAFVC